MYNRVSMIWSGNDEDPVGGLRDMLIVEPNTNTVFPGLLNNHLISIFTSVYNKNSMRQMKYLNRVVASLAISDFLFGSIGIPLSITYYYLSYTGQANVIVSRNERWQLDAIWFVPNTLTSSECLHVFLISFLFWQHYIVAYI